MRGMGRSHWSAACLGFLHSTLPEYDSRLGEVLEQKVGKITVQWPSVEPRSQSFSGLGIDRYWRIDQGVSTAALAAHDGRGQVK